MRLFIKCFRFAWFIFFGIIAWIPAIIYCLLIAIAELDYKEFSKTLDNFL